MVLLLSDVGVKSSSESVESVCGGVGMSEGEEGSIDASCKRLDGVYVRDDERVLP